MPATPLDVHVVSHTHWDREWYLPLARLRQRLVALIDELLDSPVSSGAFLLDGQAILLEDYLAVRPERAAEVRAHFERGTLEAGPWLVLADELLVSGEALVRNLLAGRRVVRALGGAPLPVLYCPDSFGHPADLPLLAAGFGVPLIILWRGLGGPLWETSDLYRWRATDGTTVLVHHLPRDGYEYGANLPDDPEAARERWGRLMALLAERARSSALLVLNGADHHALQTHRDAAIDALAAAALPHRLRASSMRDFAEALTRRAPADVPTIEGDLRASFGYAWTVPGTWSSRTHQKRLNARAERLLTREAEPWSAIVAARGGTRRGAIVRAAWRTLLECHPHDTLCGCATDDVARDASVRFASARAQALGLREDALLELAGHDRVVARTQSSRWRPQVVVFNAAPRPRGGVAEIVVERSLADEPVGPGSAALMVRERRMPSLALEDGRVPFQVLATRRASSRVESPRHYPDNDRVEVARCVAWLEEPVAGYGTTAVAIDAARRLRRGGKGHASFEPVRAAKRSIDNGWMRVDVSRRGDVTLRVPSVGLVIPSLVRFQDVGDAGDLYTHSPIEPMTSQVRHVATRVTARGPLRGELLVQYEMSLPVSSTRVGRSRRRVRQRLVLGFVLDAESRLLRVRVAGDNLARDHRLRVVLATGVEEGTTMADATFGPVLREPVPQPPATRAFEHAAPTVPLGRWIARLGRSHCMTLVSDGLAECEVMARGDIAVTLVRAVGALSRNDLPERPGHAGWPTPTPAAQCRGPFRATFNLVPSGPHNEYSLSHSEQAADDALLPLRGFTVRSALAPLASAAGLTLEGTGVRFSACKESEDGEWTVLRCVNVTARPVDATWRCGWSLREARSARLDETPGDAVTVAGNTVTVTVPPHAVSTVLVR